MFHNKHSNGLYETDIIGEWKYGEDIVIVFTKNESITKMYGVTEHNEYTLENIGDNFQYIDSGVLVPKYKYYNTLGNYYKTDGIPNTSTFDITVFSDGGAYKNEFTLDGTYISSSRVNQNPDEYKVLFTCGYFRKGNVVYKADDKSVLYYIIDDGFYGTVFFKEK